MTLISVLGGLKLIDEKYFGRLRLVMSVAYWAGWGMLHHKLSPLQYLSPAINCAGDDNLWRVGLHKLSPARDDNFSMGDATICRQVASKPILDRVHGHEWDSNGAADRMYRVRMGVCVGGGGCVGMIVVILIRCGSGRLKVF